MHGDNPAGRLLNIIERGKQIKPHESCRNAWSILLAVEPNDHSQMMIRMGRVMALPAQTVEVLKSDFPVLFESGNHRHIAACFGKGFSNQKMDGVWESFIAHIDGHAISGLQLMAHLFESSRPSKLMSSDDALEIRTQTEVLINSVLSGNFPPALKKFLIEKLKAVLDALDTYYISGAEPVLNAVAATIGAAYLNPEYRAAVKTEDGSEFASSLANLANAVTVATAAVQVGISTVPLLEFAVKSIVGNP